MGYLTLGVLILTAVALLFGALWGMKRGLNRSILRLILILGCVAGAIFLRGVVTEIIMDINVGEGTMKEMIAEAFSGEGATVPAEMQNFVFALVEILIGIVVYFLIFYVLRLVSWLILFPIIKIFVRKELIKKRWWGALIGLIQGAVIAFAVFAPATGLVSQLNTLSNIKVEGKPMIELPKELGIDEYKESFIGKTYLTIGGWYFDMLTTAKTADGKISLEDSAGAMVAVLGVAESFKGFADSMEIMSGTATAEEKAQGLKGIGNNLQDIGEKLDNLSDGAEEIVDTLLGSIKEMIGGESGGSSPEMDEFFANIKLDELDMGALGGALCGIGDYIEKTDSGYTGAEQFSQESANAIVNGFIQNELIMGLLEESGNVMQLIDIDTQYEELFVTALENAPAGTDITKIKTLLGVA